MKSFREGGWLARLESTFKLRYLSIGFIWAWVYCSYSTSAVFPAREGVSINADATWVISALVVIIAFAAFGFILRKSKLSSFSYLHIIAPLLMVIGTLISGIPAFSQGYGVYVSGFMTGTGYALMSILCIGVLRELKTSDLEMILPFAPAVTAICALLFPNLSGAVGLVATASLPLIAGLFLILSIQDVHKERTVAENGPFVSQLASEEDVESYLRREDESSGTDPRFFLARISLLLGVFYFSIGYQSALSPAQDRIELIVGMDLSTALAGVCVIVLVLFFISFSKRVDLISLFRWLIPLQILSLTITMMSYGAPTLLASIIVTVTDSLLQVLVCLYLIRLAKMGLIPLALGMGITQALVQLGVLLGNLFGNWVTVQHPVNDPGFFLSAAAIVCLIAFAGVLLPQRIVKVQTEASEEKLPDISVESEFNARCAIIIERFDLSEREGEVLYYLLRGRSQPYIREALFISKNTVATHVKNIYRKLGIHSRQELIDCFESLREDQASD